MNCQFCSNKVTKFEDGFNCYICDFSINSNYENSIQIKWQRNLGNWWWALNIYPENNESVLWGSLIDCNSKSEVKIKTIKIPYTVKNVTPDNVIQKIKTILTFQ
jgi:hypothetical protein